MLQKFETIITIMCCCMGMCCSMSSMCCALMHRMLPGLLSHNGRYRIYAVR